MHRLLQYRTIKSSPYLFKACYPLLIAVSILFGSTVVLGQSQSKNNVSILGCPEEVPVMKLAGRRYVDVQDLARITSGSVSFKGERVILVLPRCAEPKADVDGSAVPPGFSREFKIAAIEAMASIREWGGTLQTTVYYGYTIKDTLLGDALKHFNGRAADKLAIARASASTEDDRRGVELLNNEFNSIQAWSDNYIKARNSQLAAAKTMSSNGLDDDREVQKMIGCGQFLAQMFARDAFQDDASCH